nr:peroxidase-like protein 2 [Ipomoea batatas]
MLAGRGGRVSLGAEGKVGRGVFGKFKDGIDGKGGNVVVGMLGMEGICGNSEWGFEVRYDHLYGMRVYIEGRFEVGVNGFVAGVCWTTFEYRTLEVEQTRYRRGVETKVLVLLFSVSALEVILEDLHDADEALHFLEFPVELRFPSPGTLKTRLRLRQPVPEILHNCGVFIGCSSPGRGG